MKLSALTVSTFATTCALALAVSAGASAASAIHPRHAAHHHAIPASAAALSPSKLAPAPRFDDDSDGLTRRTSECNRGCVDN